MQVLASLDGAGSKVPTISEVGCPMLLNTSVVLQSLTR